MERSVGGIDMFGKIWNGLYDQKESRRGNFVFD